MRNKKIQILCTVLVVIFISITVYRNSLPDCRNKTKEFLDWYKDTSLERYKYNSIKIDEDNNFQVDISSEQKEVEFFHESNYFSQQFLNNLMNYHKKGELYYTENPQYADTPPIGFNLDLVFFSQSLPQYIYYGGKLSKEEKPEDYNLKIEKINNDGQHILVDDNFHFEFDEECKILNIDSFKTGGIRAGVINSFNKK